MCSLCEILFHRNLYDKQRTGAFCGRWSSVHGQLVAGLTIAGRLLQERVFTARESSFLVTYRFVNVSLTSSTRMRHIYSILCTSKRRAQLCGTVLESDPVVDLLHLSIRDRSPSPAVVRSESFARARTVLARQRWRRALQLQLQALIAVERGQIVRGYN